MANISFSTKPKRVYYSYKEDGCIYDISTKRPDVVAKGGGVWCCYFECDAYYKDNDVYKRLYLHKLIPEVDYNNDDFKVKADDLIPITKDSYLNTSSSSPKLYTKNDNGTVRAVGKLDKYYSKNGEKEFDMPNSCLELPFCEYAEYNVIKKFTGVDNEGDEKIYYIGDKILQYIVNDSYDYDDIVFKCIERITPYQRYYFDNFITIGSTFNNKGNNKGFKPLNVSSNNSETTFRGLLSALIEDSINLNRFEESVNELPVYLTGPNLNNEVYLIPKIGFSLNTIELIPYGSLFMKKLNAVLEEKAKSIIDKYADKNRTTLYKNAKFESKLEYEYDDYDYPIGISYSNIKITPTKEY